MAQKTEEFAHYKDLDWFTLLCGLQQDSCSYHISLYQCIVGSGGNK